MKIVDERLLGLFRGWRRCEWCGKIGLVEPHHLWCKGMGGGGRLDIPLNLIALCRICHTEVHAGQILRCDLLAIVAKREQVLQTDIEAEVWRLRRTPQESFHRDPAERFQKRLEILPNGCWRLRGSLTGSGYGRIRLRGASGKLVAAHVFAYEQKHGTIPQGMELDHLCRNRWCCNPDHVESVTHRVNVLRGNAPMILLHNAGHCLKGHEFNEKNTYFRKSGPAKGRVVYCRICRQEKRQSERNNGG